jgi:hypothetical protein
LRVGVVSEKKQIPRLRFPARIAPEMLARNDRHYFENHPKLRITVKSGVEDF